MLDTYNRDINYLRVSVTDRCNLRCVYCMPKEGVSLIGHDDILKYEEILRIVKAAVKAGITKVRITGGEPLVRRGIVEFIHALTGIKDLEDISLTTNGILLASLAGEIYQAGVRRINISLDSLDASKYRLMTRGGDLHTVLKGIEEAHRLGFSPIKINTVALKGFNDDEILDFASMAREKPFQIRFIELMPMSQDISLNESSFLPNSLVQEIIRNKYRLEPIKVQRLRTDGPARIYRLADGAGEIGFISPLSHHFCHSCNRLRLTSSGRLLSCLLYPDHLDLRHHLRSDCADEELEKLIRQSIIDKPRRHEIKADGQIRKCRQDMSGIGG